MEECCENCKFGFDIYPDKLFNKENVESSVLCHRFPPSYTHLQGNAVKNKQLVGGGRLIPGAHNETAAAWVVVNKGDWCGEYKLKDKQEQ